MEFNRKINLRPTCLWLKDINFIVIQRAEGRLLAGMHWCTGILKKWLTALSETAWAETVLICFSSVGSFIPLRLKHHQDLPATCSIKSVSQSITSHTKIVSHCYTANKVTPIKSYSLSLSLSIIEYYMILASVAGQDKLHFIKVFAKNHHTKIMYIKRNLIFSRNCEELTKSLFSPFLSNSVKTELTFHIIQRVKPFRGFSHILNIRLQSADSCSFHWRSSISANFTGPSNNGHSIQPQTLPEIYVVLNRFVLL